MIPVSGSALIIVDDSVAEDALEGFEALHGFDGLGSVDKCCCCCVWWKLDCFVQLLTSAELEILSASNLYQISTMEDIEDSSEATSHDYRLSKSKRCCQREVRDLLQQLSSWREESNRQFSNIIDSHTSSINKGINDLSEEVCDLRTKLSVITQERNNLLQNVKTSVT